MRYGSILQRRLVQLESTIKVPTVEDRWTSIQAEALSKLSIEDLRILRDIVAKQGAGIAVEDTQLNHDVVARCNAACDQARANHARYAKSRESYR